MPLVEAYVWLLVYRKPVLAESPLRQCDQAHQTTLPDGLAARKAT